MDKKRTMNSTQSNEFASDQTPEEVPAEKHTKPVVIDLNDEDNASDEGADASKRTDGRGSSGGWGAGTN